MVVPASPIAGSRSGKDAFGTLCQGRFGVFASYTWTWESMVVIGEAPLCDASLAIEQVRVHPPLDAHFCPPLLSDRRGGSAGSRRATVASPATSSALRCRARPASNPAPR